MYLAREKAGDQSAKRFHDLFCHQQWNVGVVLEPISIFLEPDARPEVHWFSPLERGRFLADPFGIEKGGEFYVFCEEYDYESDKGVIASMPLSLDGPGPRRVAIEEPFHLSYPYVFEWRGDVYCVPESHRAREIGLYKSNGLPYRWLKVATLVPNFAGVDPTVFFHEGRWWIACADADAGANDTLFLWYAPELCGPWLPHPGNPVKRGRRNTRPAGTPFLHKGEMFRPAMDSSRTYGKRIVLNRVRALTPGKFEEEPVASIEPFTKGGFRDGVHTVSAVGDITLVDGLRVTFQRAEFRRAVAKERRLLLGRLSPLWHKE